MYQYGKRVIIIELSVNFHKEFTDYIAGSIKHVYYNDKIIVAQQDSLGQPTWYIIQPREYDYLNGAWDDRIIGPVSTEQREKGQHPHARPAA